MTTLRVRLREQDHDRFVGRRDELALFTGLLDGTDPRRVVHLVGQGGIGKSALLREVTRRAEARGAEVVWIDGRDIAPFPGEAGEAVQGLTDTGPAVVIFDSYELISALDGHLRDVVIPDLPDSTLVVFASRQPPSRGWFEQGWDTIVQVLELAPLDDATASALLERYGVDDAERVDQLVQQSRGSPLALSVGAGSHGGPSAVSELAERLLGDEVDPDRMRTLGVAAIARVTTPELLADVLADDPQESYKWLADRSFAEPLATGVTLHALVAEAVRTRLRAVDPLGEGVLRRRIADHLHRRALDGNAALSTDLQHLIVDPTLRWGYSSDVGRRFRIDVLRADDIAQITEILESAGAGVWWNVTRSMFEHHPEVVSIARDPSGGVGGYAVTVTPSNAPALARDDVLLGPWLRYSRDVLRTDSAVLWREAIDLTGELGEVTSLLGAGGLMSSGISNPRYLFLPIAPEMPAAQEFSARLDGQHVPDLDLHAYGIDLECHVVDNGSGGLIGTQRDWIYRETGAVPPTDRTPVEAGDLLKLLRDPSLLASGPDWLGASPSIRLERLRELGTEALAVFGTTADDDVARRIVTAAYLSDNQAHEAIARQLHLSRSAYFRRLQGATGRFGAELAVAARRSR